MLERPLAEPERVGGWRFSAGYIYRDLGGVRFETGSHAQDVLLRSMVGSPFRRGSGAGAPDAPDQRLYDDGFVFIDSSGSTDGLTWFWGYQKAEQVVGDYIVMHSSAARERKVWQSSQRSPSSWSEDIGEGGPLLNLEYQFPVANKLKAGVGLGFSVIDWDESKRSGTFQASQLGVERQSFVTDAFSLGGSVPPLPPYAGTYEGPGVLLDIIPSARDVSTNEVDRVRFDFFNRIDESLEFDLYTLSPGLTIEWREGPVFVNVGAGVAINIVDWSADYHETLYVSKNRGRPSAMRTWRDHSGGTDVVWGGYVQAGVGAQLTGRLSVQGFARYDWADEFSGKVGPSSFSVDLDGFSGGVMASWNF